MITALEPVPRNASTTFWPKPGYGVMGVLGGMGPLATIDFLQKMLAHTPARRDQEHVPVVVASLPQIPDRTAAFQRRGPSPLAALVESGQRLVDAGAAALVMPCNTAHLWFEEMERALKVPMLHIVDATLATLGARANGNIRSIGLLATAATIDSHLYPTRAASRSSTEQLMWITPTVGEMNELVSPAIAAVKAGRTGDATERLAAACQALRRRGAEAVLMGCTEIPLALCEGDVGLPLVDATDALAAQAVRWSRNWGT